MAGFMLKRIDELTSIHHGVLKLAGDELGVQSFGLQVIDLPPDFDDYPDHDHTEDGQEEVYVVLEGSAECEVGDERLHAEAGSMLWVDAPLRRKLRSGPRGVRVLAIGCAPAGAYERPASFRLASHA